MNLFIAFLFLLPSSTYITGDALSGGIKERCGFQNQIERAYLPSMPGWPKTLTSHPNYASCGATMTDLDGDGIMEIMAGSTSGEFKLWDIDGNIIWEKSGLGMIQSKPAIGDIDLDGEKEIVITNRTNTIYIWNFDGSNHPGWPAYVGETSGLKSPVLFDLDGDDTLEIILGERDYPKGKINVFKQNGTLLWSDTLDYMCVATPAVGDIDNDSIFEIVAASYYSIFVWDANGNLEPGWPLTIAPAGGMSYSQPTLVDLDNDGNLEIAITYYDWNLSNDYLGIWKYDATTFLGWPQDLWGGQSYGTPVPADVDFDSIIELCDASSHYMNGPLHLFSSSGTEEPGWPFYFSGFLEGTPVVFDFDDDGYMELLVANNSTPGEIYVLNYDGTQIPGAPFDVQGTFMVNGATVGDADGDGDIEICLLVTSGTTAYVNLFTLESIPYKGYLAPYFSWFHDIWNTGWMHPACPNGLSLSTTRAVVRAEWNKNQEPDIYGYFVYRSDSTGGPYQKLNTTPYIDTFYFDTTVIEGQKYFYTVSAVIKAGTESYLSLEDSITIPASVFEREHTTPCLNIFCPTLNRKFLEIKFTNLKAKNNKIEIIDITGRRIREWNIHKSSGILITKLPRGIYFITLNKETILQKVIVL
ncbi:MAG: T9SS type A sorting domain-containing protein [Candidatus Cloacimonadota bacterium]|nr:MAG: T9SS type A sorting domain-containing protein [Candidatus Cloacimonadota bacterium]